MTFGRPNITGGLSGEHLTETTTLDIVVRDDREKLKVAFLAPCARLSLVLNQILSQVYPPSPRRSGNGSSSPTSRETIASLEKQLDAFEESLPPCLSWKVSGTGAQPADKDRILLMQSNVLHAR
jgi:hypothetical protein